MSLYDRAHLDDDSLEHSFDTHAAQECGAIASLLADIAEIDARHLFLRAGFESMRAYCMQKLHLTEDAAAKRIQVARLARELPALFPAIGGGGLHLTAVGLLASRLNRSNVDEWIAAAARKTVREIEVLLAVRYPQPEILQLDGGITPQVIARQSTTEITTQVVVPQHSCEIRHVSRHVEFARQPVPSQVRPKITPLSGHRFLLEFSFRTAAHDKLLRAQERLGHAVPSGDIAEVMERGIDALHRELDRQQFGIGARSGQPRAAGTRRSIPAQIRKAVFERDGGRCAFIHRDGRGCGSTRRLEFDHIVPFARGGKTTIENLRLLCRAHNQHEAERAFGREYIAGKANRRWCASP